MDSNGAREAREDEAAVEVARIMAKFRDNAQGTPDESGPAEDSLLEDFLKCEIRRLPKAFRGGFETFLDDTDERKAILGAAQEWVAAFQLGQAKGVLLGGMTGCGKTHLGCGILRGLIERGVWRVRYLNAADFFSDLRATWGSNESERGVFDDILCNDVVFLDDLGSEANRGAIAEHTGEALYSLLDRMIRDVQPVLIVSTNLNREGLNMDFPGSK